MFKTMTLAVCALFTTASADLPGFGMSISQQGLTNARNVAVPLVFSQLEDLHIDEIDFDGGNFRNI